MNHDDDYGWSVDSVFPCGIVPLMIGLGGPPLPGHSVLTGVQSPSSSAETPLLFSSSSRINSTRVFLHISRLSLSCRPSSHSVVVS